MMFLIECLVLFRINISFVLIKESIINEAYIEVQVKPTRMKSSYQKEPRWTCEDFRGNLDWEGKRLLIIIF